MVGPGVDLTKAYSNMMGIFFNGDSTWKGVEAITTYIGSLHYHWAHTSIAQPDSQYSYMVGCQTYLNDQYAHLCGIFSINVAWSDNLLATSCGST